MRWLLCDPRGESKSPGRGPRPRWRRVLSVGILGQVRRLVRLAALSLARPAVVDVISGPAAPEPERGNFRRDAAAPHQAEAAAILSKVRNALNQADNALASDYDPAGQEHMRFYREVLGPLKYARRMQPDNIDVLRLYAQVCDALGKTGEAIDVLANAVPLNAPYYSTEAALVAFSLAVQYDRDEQHGAAFEVLDRMQSVLQGQMAALVQTSLAQMRFAPAEDQHYYLGLLYEAVGSYPEARAEWALYANAADLPYRGRALDHIAAIDALRKAPPAPTTSVPRRYRGAVP